MRAWEILKDSGFSKFELVHSEFSNPLALSSIVSNTFSVVSRPCDVCSLFFSLVHKSRSVHYHSRFRSHAQIDVYRFIFNYLILNCVYSLQFESPAPFGFLLERGASPLARSR